jgi:uncharacterized protein (DUF924 family)
MDNDPERVLSFWFGELDADGLAPPAVSKQWWTKDAAFDGRVRDAFLEDHRAIVGAQREHWLGDPRGRLAYIVVLDQFSRNMFRGTAQSFASDPQALRAAKGGVEAGADAPLAVAERTFMYMPFMHSESLADQDRCIELFTALRDAQTGRARDNAEYSLKFAGMHRDIVVRFGRFPHRNAILGRASTPEEVSFLEGPNSGF